MAGIFKPLKVDGRRVCVNCETPVQRRSNPWLRCDPCSHQHHLWMTVLNGKAHCASRLARAITSGAIRPARHFTCVDCGLRAQCYDHRDYGEPLRVVPVCTRCNIRRGPARPLNPILVSALLLAHFSKAG